MIEAVAACLQGTWTLATEAEGEASRLRLADDVAAAVEHQRVLAKLQTDLLPPAESLEYLAV